MMSVLLDNSATIRTILANGGINAAYAEAPSVNEEFHVKLLATGRNMDNGEAKPPVDLLVVQRANATDVRDIILAKIRRQ